MKPVDLTGVHEPQGTTSYDVSRDGVQARGSHQSSIMLPYMWVTMITVYDTSFSSVFFEVSRSFTYDCKRYAKQIGDISHMPSEIRDMHL